MKKYFLLAAVAAFTVSCKEKKEVENNTNMSDSMTTDTMTPPADPMPQDTNTMMGDSASTSKMRKDSMK